VRNHLFPTFTMDADSFERSLPIITNLAQKLALSCHCWREGAWYAIAFKDQAVDHDFYYTAKHEQIMINKLKKEIVFDLFYAAEDTFNNGKAIS